MAETKQKPDPDESVLVAYVTVHLDGGESLELLPFAEADDVKSKVEDLLEDWARTGFLLRGNQFIPWRRVQQIEAARVVEMTRSELQSQCEQNGTLEGERQQQRFWKTRKAREKKDEGGGKGEQRAA